MIRLRDWMVVLTVGGWLAAVLTGCQTVESSRPGAEDEDIEPITEERGEVRTFLEVVEPVPSYIAEEDGQRAAWRGDDYEDDKRRSFRAFAIPTRYSMSQQEFESNPDQQGVVGPYVIVQLRQRQQVTVTKHHQVVIRARFSGERQLRNEHIPIYSEWRWEPDRAVVGSGSVLVTIEEMDDAEGAFSRFEGTVDEQGRFRMSLVPLLRAHRILRSTSSVTLLVRVPDLGLNIEVSIPSRVLLHYAQQRTQFRMIGEGPASAE